MPNYKTGGNLVSGDRFGDDEGNAVKNHYYGDTAPANAVAGVIWIDSDDDRAYRYDGANWVVLGPDIVGTWTPAISFGLASVGIVYGGTNGGRYVRFGNWVSITGWMVLTDKGSSNGNARIEDLPFTCKNDDASYSPATVRLENISFADQWTAWVVKNADALDLFEVTNGGILSALTDANFANNSTVMISATYEIEV